MNQTKMQSSSLHYTKHGSPYLSHHTQKWATWVNNFGTTAKHTCDFLLANNSNFLHILHHFRDIVRYWFHFCCFQASACHHCADITPPPSHYRMCACSDAYYVFSHTNVYKMSTKRLHHLNQLSVCFTDLC